jgi:hypothetical protein
MGLKKLREERLLKAEQEKAYAEAELRDQGREVALEEAEAESRLQEQVQSATNPIFCRQEIRFLG